MAVRLPVTALRDVNAGLIRPTLELARLARLPFKLKSNDKKKTVDRGNLGNDYKKSQKDGFTKASSIQLHVMMRD